MADNAGVLTTERRLVLYDRHARWSSVINRRQLPLEITVIATQAAQKSDTDTASSHPAFSRRLFSVTTLIRCDAYSLSPLHRGLYATAVRCLSVCPFVCHLHGAIVPANAYQRTKFQLPSSNSFRNIEGVRKFNVGATTLCRIPYAETFTYALSTWQGEIASQISASYLYASCSYANMYFQWAFHCTCPKMGFLRVLRVKMWKCCVLTPERHYPAWIRVCWCIACQSRFNGLSSRSVERFCVQKRNLKKLSGNFGYMGRSNPWSWPNVACGETWWT